MEEESSASPPSSPSVTSDEEEEEEREEEEDTDDQTPPGGRECQTKEPSFSPIRNRRYSWASRGRSYCDSGISVTSGSPDCREAQKDGNDVYGASDAGREEQDQEDDDDDDSRSTDASKGPWPPPPVKNTLALPDPDTAVRRIQEQEEAMRQHILHNPQPRRVSRPPVTAALEPAPVVPLFDNSPPYGPPYGVPPPIYPYLPHVTPVISHPYPQPPPPFPFQPNLYPPPAAIEPDLSKTTLAGYELIASRLTSRTGKTDDNATPFAPVYRKFEKLNHRILLHLQDEIAELEEELRLIDERIAQMTPEVGARRLQPASRRAEADYGGEYYRRTELLGRIFVKLGQYNQALASYSSAVRNFAPADAADVQAYRAFLEKQTPIEQDEARFLLDEADLMALPKRPAAAAAAAIATQPPTARPSMALRRSADAMLAAVVASLAVFTSASFAPVWLGVPLVFAGAVVALRSSDAVAAWLEKVEVQGAWSWW